jgi:hypothetical protein
MPISEKDYIKDPSKCPVCGSEDISGGDLEFESGIITQEIWCPECNALWRDIYELTGYDQLVEGKDLPG